MNVPERSRPLAGEPPISAAGVDAVDTAANAAGAAGAAGVAGVAGVVTAPTAFQPRMEAEEGDPRRFDFVFLLVIVALVVLALMWAMGVFNIPGIPF